MTWTRAAYDGSRRSFRDRLDRQFWSKTDRTSDCWVWTGARRTPARTGGPSYGVIRRHGRVEYAHRVAYERANGPIPTGLLVLHSCDNPPCINPAHLRVGTVADNAADAVARRRTASGEANGRARLTADDVRAIRSLVTTASQSEVAEMFGVKQSTVSLIASGRRWKGVIG